MSFLKIDVENAESQVLMGASTMIARNRPVILIEILGNFKEKISDWGDRSADTIKQIVSMGYIVRRIDRFDYLALPVEFACKEIGWNLTNFS